MAHQQLHLHLTCIGVALCIAPSARAIECCATDDPPIETAEVLETEADRGTGFQPRPLKPVIVQPSPADADSPTAGPGESWFHLSIGTDYTTAYFSRGFRYEDSGWILQPYADLVLDVLELDQARLSLTLGTWSSFHDLATDAQTTNNFTKHWYELDLYAGVALAAGAWSLEARYYFYLSPSNAFDTVEELYFSAAFDDSQCMGAWALNPSVILAFETGPNATDGLRLGTYLQLGIAPGFTFDDGLLKDSELSFPVSLGLSLSNYYEGANGENDFFGFVGFGPELSVPLDFGETPSGWTLSASLQGLYLGDAASTFNDSNHFEVIATVGLSFEF